MEEVVTLIDEETLKARIDEIAKAISRDYKGRDLVMVCILKGAAPFFTHLCERIEGVNITQEYMKVTSYENRTESNGKPIIEFQTKMDIEGKDVLVVEDIIDSGHSLDFVVNTHLPLKNPKSVETAVMLDKPDRRVNFGVVPKYTGFTIPDLWVAGKGLDDDEKYRELPYVLPLL